MFYGFAEVADWRAFQHFEQIAEILENRRCNTSIVCNECETVVRRVPATELQRTLDEMESSLDMRTDMCPHCGKVNVFPVFSTMMVYICQECGESVNLGAGCQLDRIACVASCRGQVKHTWQYHQPVSFSG